MAKVTVVFVPGCEKVEGLTIVDAPRRIRIETTMVGSEGPHVLGAHEIELTYDEVMSDRLPNYDVVALPGGRRGAQKPHDNDKSMKLMQKHNTENKWDAAVCAAPVALTRYGLLDNRNYTCFPGTNGETTKVAPTTDFREDITVVDNDGKIITSCGPATALAFAYQIAEVSGYNTDKIRHEVLYDYLMDQKQAIKVKRVRENGKVFPHPLNTI